MECFFMLRFFDCYLDAMEEMDGNPQTRMHFLLIIDSRRVEKGIPSIFD